MHFTYAKSPDLSSLMQGDVLKRTLEVDALLKEVHPHFYEKSKNLYFMVLTQSCDLVLRSDNGCKSPYITIAPIRSFDEVLNRQIQVLNTSELQSELPVIGEKGKSKLSEFLQRLYNNNEPGYFFLEASETALPYDCCAFLNLSIAIKSDLHYKECLGAKILELDASFQAKLGWLVGQLFSRVGTEDWLKEKLTPKVNAALRDVAIWVPDQKFNAVVEKAPKGKLLSAQDVKGILRSIPDKKKQVLERTAEIISELIGEEDPELLKVADKLNKRLSSDSALTSLLK